MTLDTGTLSNITLVVVTLTGMYLAGFWLALIIWTFRDHRARSRDGLASIIAAITVAILNLPGLLIYLLLRPKETLAEAYERSLEEEALLQEIEEKPMCPGCGRPSAEDWQICPYCHTTLKKSCVKCNHKLELAWKICPHCTAPQPGFAAADEAQQASSRHVRPQSAAVPAGISATSQVARPPSNPPEYIDNDPYRS